jgi:hypothetical protein
MLHPVCHQNSYKFLLQSNVIINNRVNLELLFATTFIKRL